MIKFDDYNTVINHEDTYQGIVDTLRHDGRIIIAWTDEASTQLDILFCFEPDQYGNLQRGMSASTDLFVAVSNCGMFGFELNGCWKAPDYVGKKLGLGEKNETTEKLAELINEVCNRLIIR